MRPFREWFKPRSHEAAFDPGENEEVHRAVELLVGVKHTRRKHGRRRTHLTYAHRDALAKLITRLSKPQREDD